MDKLGKLELNAWTIMGLAILAYIVYDPFQDWVNETLGGIGGKPSVPSIECIYDGAVMTIGPVVKKYDPATAVASPGSRVFVKGKNRGVKTDSATLDVNFKDDIIIYYGHNNTDADVSKFGYYVSKQSLTVPCTSAFSSADDDVDPTASHQLVRRALPTMTAFTDDTGLIMTNTHWENMTANDASNMQVKLVQPAETGYSPYGKKYVCLRYNSSLYTEAEVTGTSGTPALTSAGTPTVVTNHANRWIGSTSGMTVECWTNAGISGQNTITEYYNVYLESGSSTPQKQHHANVTLSIWDEEWYKHSDTEEMIYNIENDQYGDIGKRSTANATLRIGA